MRAVDLSFVRARPYADSECPNEEAIVARHSRSGSARQAMLDVADSRRGDVLQIDRTVSVYPNSAVQHLLSEAAQPEPARSDPSLVPVPAPVATAAGAA